MEIILGCDTPYKTEPPWVLAFRTNLHHRKEHVPYGIILSGDFGEGPRQCPPPQTQRLILD